MQISRIRLSDKTAHLCTRKVIRSSPEPPHRAVLPRRAPTERSAHNRQCHHLGGHSLPGSQSGFFLHFSMWHLPQRLHVTGVSQGCPNLPCFATFSARLELRPLSSTGITRLPRYYGPFRHPIAPYLTVTGLRLVATTDHAMGLPVLRAFPSCVHAVATTPAQGLRALPCSFPQPYQPSPKVWSGLPVQRPFRGLLSVHSRYGLHTRQVT